MNIEQLYGILRAFVPSLFAFAVARGWLGQSEADWIIAGAPAVIAAVWSFWTKRPASVGAQVAQLLERRGDYRLATEVERATKAPPPK